MGTLKKSKLWYACEGSTLIYPLNLSYPKKTAETPTRHNSYEDGSSTSKVGVYYNGIRTPAWKTISGVSYNYLPMLEQGAWYDSSSQEQSQGRMVYSWSMGSKKTFQYVEPHLCNEDISDYDADEYAITNVISDLDIIDYQIAYINSGESSGVTISITVSNPTQNDIAINCIKFVKDVRSISDPDQLTAYYIDYSDFHNTHVKALYISYYFDQQEEITIYSEETKVISFSIIPDDVIVSNVSLKKTKTWKAYEQLRLAPYSMWASSGHYIGINAGPNSNMGVQHYGMTIDPDETRPFFVQESNPEKICEWIDNFEVPNLGWTEMTDYYDPTYYKGSNYWSKWQAQTRMLTFPHQITPIFVFERGIENHSEFITEEPFITEKFTNYRRSHMLGFDNIKSRIDFTENEMAVYFTIYLINTEYQNGYTARSILFCRPLFASGYDENNPVSEDIPAPYQYDRMERYQLDSVDIMSKKVFYPYVYFYLTNPVVVPYGKTRIITVKITPEKIEVQNNGG